MSKVTSINPGGALDLDARDPNNLNEHLQVVIVPVVIVIVFVVIVIVR